MKKTLAFAASLFLLGACSSDGYTIRGKIAGLDTPYVYLLRFTGQAEVIDSAKVTKESFVFRGKAETPEMVYLSTDRQQPFARFFLENGRIEVDGSLSAPADIAVLGTASNDTQRAFDERIASLEEEFARAGLDKKVWQYFTVVPDFKSVGMKNNARVFEYMVIIRAINTIDAMSASIEKVDWDVLETITGRILSEVENVNRVCYDMSPKPPATIEFE